MSVTVRPAPDGAAQLDPESNRIRAIAGQSVNVVGAMLTIVVAAVVGYVGLLVTSETENSLDLTANSAFSNASKSLTSGLSTAFSLTEVVFIVIMLSIIIGVLTGLRR